MRFIVNSHSHHYQSPHFHRRGNFGGLPASAARHRAFQFGGSLAVYRGARHYQHGQGFGAILKTIFKTAAPYVKKSLPFLAKSGKKLIKTVIQNREAGQNWGDSIRDSLAPTGLDMLKQATKFAKSVTPGDLTSAATSLSPADDVNDNDAEAKKREEDEQKQQKGSGHKLTRRRRYSNNGNKPRSVYKRHKPYTTIKYHCNF